MRKSVVFLYYMRKGAMKPAGTALWGGWPVPDHWDRPIAVLLTADHVIRGIRRRSDDGKVLVRINTQQGPAELLETDAEDWKQGDPNVDCAALPLSPENVRVLMRYGGVEVLGWHLGGRIATSTNLEIEGIGVGDEVFMVGLFRNHLGQDRNEPIVRVGNIAAIPVDPIRSRLYGDMRVILIEARSIGGLSGSPVFVHMGYARWVKDRVKVSAADSPFLFLGLMHGHWEVLEAEADEAQADETGEKINTGIGLVVPCEQVLNSIRPMMEKRAKMRKQELDVENEPTPDEAEPGSEFERFEDLTSGLLQVSKEELDDKLKDEG